MITLFELVELPAVLITNTIFEVDITWGNLNEQINTR